MKLSESEEQKLNATIEKAKDKVVRTYGGMSGRAWLEASPENSYGNEGYHVSVLVLEGSPPKGYVLVDYNSGIVKAFGLRLKPLYTYKAWG